MAYILFVNPQILRSVASGGTYTVPALLSGRRVHPLLIAFSAIFVWYFIHGVVG
jgi:hypothetical protein